MSEVLDTHKETLVQNGPKEQQQPAKEEVAKSFGAIKDVEVIVEPSSAAPQSKLIKTCAQKQITPKVAFS